jgi:hypothetical protein
MEFFMNEKLQGRVSTLSYPVAIQGILKHTCNQKGVKSPWEVCFRILLWLKNFLQLFKISFIIAKCTINTCVIYFNFIKEIEMKQVITLIAMLGFMGAAVAADAPTKADAKVEKKADAKVEKKADAKAPAKTEAKKADKKDAPAAK